ncbi:hypothetical protein SKAU_G00135590 [Synaphobranchus kaupii]|uniref:Peptidase A2 domain-containing protein n=1 Tax=Synaphobranchus kaupii TaxID=118154 RepID=A0A9Q1J3S0_SYNKA|nr:hypothetical protein SKAU_G00135590 [Synaphobranchus kaupii]
MGREQTQKKLLAVPDLIWKKAVELTLAQEAADQGAQALQPPKDVHKVTASPQAERGGRASQLLTCPQRSCYHCGESHSSDVCKFKDVDCCFCGKRGHISQVCRQKEREGNKGPQSGKCRGNWAHIVAVLSPTPPEEYEDEEEEIAVVLAVCDKSPSPMVVEVEVDLNRCKVSFEVDTGASRSVIGEATYKRNHGYDSALKLTPSSTVLRSYTGQNIKVCGSVCVMADYKGQEALLNLLVVSGRGTNLLGRDWIKLLNLHSV